jgi:hypothetical protein
MATPDRKPGATQLDEGNRESGVRPVVRVPNLDDDELDEITITRVEPWRARQIGRDQH